MQNRNNISKYERSNYQIIISSQAAALVTNLMMLPSETLKVRQQIASLQKIINNKPLLYNPNSVISTFQYIVKNEGYGTFTNGLKYSLLRASGSNFTMFLSYEKVKEKLIRSGKISNFYIIPFIASGISQTLATTVTFPLEYWKTVQQSHSGASKVEGLKLGNSLFSAYIVTIKKNLVFHLIYWTFSESMRKKLGYYGQDSSYNSEKLSYKQVVGINMFSGIYGSFVAGFFIAPFDNVKTRKQVFSDKYKNQSTVRMIKDIIQKEGFSQLYLGLKPGLISVILYGGCMLSVYETTYKILNKLNLFNQNNTQFDT